MIWAVLGLAISHGISFAENYILGGEYRKSSLKKLMHQPYQRIIVMHLAILLGGILVMELNSPLPLLFILIGLKIALDLQLHLKSHKSITQKTKQEEHGV